MTLTEHAEPVYDSKDKLVGFIIRHFRGILCDEVEVYDLDYQFLAKVQTPWEAEAIVRRCGRRNVNEPL
jgi:hypothetical protein